MSKETDQQERQEALAGIFKDRAGKPTKDITKAPYHIRDDEAIVAAFVARSGNVLSSNLAKYPKIRDAAKAAGKKFEPIPIPEKAHSEPEADRMRNDLIINHVLERDGLLAENPKATPRQSKSQGGPQAR